MQREFCPCVAWLLHLFVFWVGLKALSFFMLCIVAEQDGLQAKKGNMLLTYSGVISHGTVFEKGLCFLCLRVTAEGIFILPECPQLPLSLFMYVCLHAWVCLQQAANSLVDRIVSAVLSESRLCLSQSRLNRRSCPLLQLRLSSNPSFYNSSKTSVRTLNTCLFMYLLSCQC